MEDENVTITARCLCNTHVFTSTLPRSSLPLVAPACHCTSCRHLSGALCSVAAPWPNPDEDLSRLKRYSFSPNLVTFSCETCSSQLFCRDAKTGRATYVVTGALDNVENLVTYGRHVFVGDTKDGGSSVWLRKDASGNPIRNWEQRASKSKELLHPWPTQPIEAESLVTQEPTPIWCHCKGVQLLLNSGLDLAAGTDKIMSDKPDPKTGKYITHFDACDSCRLGVGADLIYWAFAPIDHLSFSSESSSQDSTFQNIHELRDAVERRDHRVGTLSIYSSSKGVYRYHCATCSASLFFTEEGYPDQVDIAIGVLDHPTGARAEGLLLWDYAHVDHQQDTKGGWREGLVRRALEEARVRQ
ncbi:hypothetical protein ACJZ2D_001770 [Fusarium nematophilum]